MKQPLMPCPACEGTGKVLDPVAAGRQMRALRLKEKLSLREVARRMGISAPYVQDMELGRRNCKGRLIDYLEALSKSNERKQTK
jgi:transcriptional regulator with XRE-family HTH domain